MLPFSDDPIEAVFHSAERRCVIDATDGASKVGSECHRSRSSAARGLEVDNAGLGTHGLQSFPRRVRGIFRLFTEWFPWFVSEGRRGNPADSPLLSVPRTRGWGRPRRAY